MLKKSSRSEILKTATDFWKECELKRSKKVKILCKGGLTGKEKEFAKSGNMELIDSGS